MCCWNGGEEVNAKEIERGGGVAPHRKGPERDPTHCLRGIGGSRSTKSFYESPIEVAQLTIAARWCIVLCNKGILHLGARGHQEAPVRQ
jgi:hypothetical protein